MGFGSPQLQGPSDLRALLTGASQHYLQRFWEKLPDQGQIVVFDRSWYGRVLVERVEQLATTHEWKRAYREINEFERTLVADGIRLVKIFLHITPTNRFAASRIG